MNDSKRFSKRFGLDSATNTEIVVRNDAPYDLRGVVINIAYEAGFTPAPIRNLICRILRKRPNPSNWSEWPNIAGEVEELIDNCNWYEVYDIIEEIHKSLQSGRKKSPLGEDIDPHEHFSKEINKYFLREGIGWQLIDGHIQVRGPEIFEETTRTAIEVLDSSNKKTASNEIHQALSDLSRRPNPDITGAIQHALAALECVARDVCGDKKSTLGDILKRNPGLIPSPLDKSVEKAWGYASEHGRHLREGHIPEIEEAELLVGIASTVATYLTKKATNKSSV